MSYSASIRAASIWEVVATSFDVRGRSTLAEGFIYWLATFFISLAAMWIVFTFFLPFSVLEIIGLALNFPLIAWSARRFHDHGRSALFLLPIAIAYIVSAALPASELLLQSLFGFSGAFAWLVLILWPHDEGENRFGPNPRLDYV